MNKQDHNRAAIDLIVSMLRQAPQQYTTEKGRWVWTAGRLASILTRLSTTDPQLRRELNAIKESKESKKK